MCSGYWGDAQASARMQAQLVGTGEGPFLRTGDRGFLWQGDLFVVGRISDLVIVRGANHHPHDLEASAERSHPDLRPGGAAAFSVDDGEEERVVVVAEVRDPDLATTSEVVGAVREAIADAHGLDLSAVVLVRPGTLPKTSNGKIRRRACADDFRNGALAAVAEWRPGSPAADVSTSPASPSLRDTIQAHMVAQPTHTGSRWSGPRRCRLDRPTGRAWDGPAQLRSPQADSRVAQPDPAAAAAAVTTAGPTPEVGRAIELAFEESRLMSHGFVGTEHLLLGVLGAAPGPAAALADAGVTPASARHWIRASRMERVRIEGSRTPVETRVPASGSLERTGVQSLLYLAANARATGTLTLRPPGAPAVALHFLFGQLFHAEGGGVTGDDAVLSALALREGAFEFDARSRLPYGEHGAVVHREPGRACRRPR